MADYKKTSKIITILFAVSNILIGIYNIFFSDLYHTSIAFAGVLFLAAPIIFYKLFNISKLFELEIIYYSFSFLAYTLGIVCGLYKITSFYDKLIHTVSGIFFSFIAIVVYSFIKRKIAEKGEYMIVSIFSFSFSMAVASLWEICEYVINLIFKTDPQNFLTTGLNDTMLDIIVCLIGTLIFQISLYLFFKKDKSTYLLKLYSKTFKNL